MYWEAKTSNSNVPSVEKCPVLLVLPYIGFKYKTFDKNIKDIMEKTYFFAKPRIIFKSNPILTPREKTIYPKITIVMLYTRSNAAVSVAILVRPLDISK